MSETRETQTVLDRLIEADKVQGGTIHDYNRRFGVDVSGYTIDDWTPLARRMLNAGKFAEAKLAAAVVRTYFTFA